MGNKDEFLYGIKNEFNGMSCTDFFNKVYNLSMTDKYINEIIKSFHMYNFGDEAELDVLKSVVTQSMSNVVFYDILELEYEVDNIAPGCLLWECYSDYSIIFNIIRDKIINYILNNQIIKIEI